MEEITLYEPIRLPTLHIWRAVSAMYRNWSSARAERNRWTNSRRARGMLHPLLGYELQCDLFRGLARAGEYYARTAGPECHRAATETIAQ